MTLCIKYWLCRKIYRRICKYKFSWLSNWYTPQLEESYWSNYS